MDDPDKKHFAEMLEGLATSTKGKLTTGVLKVYWLTLKDIPREHFDAGIGRAVAECEFFPSVAELRALSGHGKQKPQPHYLRPVEDELERIETCQAHTRDPHARADFVPWCRKCRRLRIAAAGAGQPQTIGELLQVKALAPLEGDRR
jgi:hypothetical protein